MAQHQQQEGAALEELSTPDKTAAVLNEYLMGAGAVSADGTDYRLPSVVTRFRN